MGLHLFKLELEIIGINTYNRDDLVLKFITLSFLDSVCIVFCGFSKPSFVPSIERSLKIKKIAITAKIKISMKGIIFPFNKVNVMQRFNSAKFIL